MGATKTGFGRFLFLIKCDRISKMKKKNLIFLIVIIFLLGAVFWFWPKKPAPLNESPYEAKLRELEKELKNKPQDYNILIEIAWLKQRLGDFEGAEKTYFQILELRPEDYIPWLNLGTIYEQRKEWEKARDAFKKAIEVNPSYVPTYRRLADVYWFHLPEEKEEIEKLYLDGLESTNGHPDLMRGLAYYYQNTGRLKEAKIYWERVLQLYPEDESVKRAIEEIEEKLKQ